MQDRFQAGKCARVAEHRGTEGLARHGFPLDGRRKGSRDRTHRHAAGGQQVVYAMIGAEHRHAYAAKHRGGGRLSHADGAGEPYDAGARHARERS